MKKVKSKTVAEISAERHADLFDMTKVRVYLEKGTILLVSEEHIERVGGVEKFKEEYLASLSRGRSNYFK